MLRALNRPDGLSCKQVHDDGWKRGKEAHELERYGCIFIAVSIGAFVPVS